MRQETPRQCIKEESTCTQRGQRLGPKRGRGPRQGAKTGWNLEGLSGGPERRETRRKQVGVWSGRGQQRLARVEGAKLSRNFTDSKELGA